MALIPPFFLDCVVAIGFKNSDGLKSWIGTGFLIGRFFRQRDEGLNDYHIFLVTNKHVLEGKNSVVVRFNPQPQSNEPARDYDLTLSDEGGNKRWTEHPTKEIDVAVININAKILREHGMKFSYFYSDKHLLNVDGMTEMGTTEGDFIFVLGYPMGIVAPDWQYVIARSGIIARIRDVLEGRSKSFIVDAFVFPGNSGGPVVSKPEVVSIGGTKASLTAYLIGIVTAYVPYQDIAISQQTGRPRVVFEENSGLTAVIPVDYIMETIEICFKDLKVNEEETTKKSADN